MILLLLACAETAEDTCTTLCRHLVEDCDYTAYPSVASCQQGCAYSADQGGDVEGEATCIEKADCDTFAIVDCEHKFGMGQ